MNRFNLNLLYLVEPTDPSPVDYDWNQYEQTEQLTHVQDDEVPVKPYRSSSKHSDEDSNVDEQWLAFYKFKQQALIEMMDGVLEKRWEDELKKDVPKPQCMVVYTYFEI